MTYVFIRIFLVPLLLIGYLLYQILIKNKKLTAIQNDCIFIVVTCVVILLFYFLITL